MADPTFIQMAKMQGSPKTNIFVDEKLSELSSSWKQPLQS